MTKHLLLFLSILILNSCSYTEIKNPSTTNLLSHTDSLKLIKFKSDSLDQQNYYSFINKLGEPDLRTYNSESYRFVLWQAFDTCSVLFRIEKDSIDSVRMTVKYFRFHESLLNKADTLLKKLVINLTIGIWKIIKAKANECYLWSLEYDDNPKRDGISDGSTWWIEAKKFPNSYEYNNLACKDYTFIYRRCPYKGSLYEFGKTIIKISKSFDPQQLYPGN